MKDIKWLDGNKIQIAPPKKTKKITGTRFATILGLNPWSTPFEMWCAITKTYEVPFEDTIYTIAGKTIEPKQAEYMRKSYAMDLTTPEDIWGKDYFNKTWGDFFPKNKYLGGMWDFLQKDDAGKITAVLEMKTTKRAEDWSKDIPDYYGLQASLYAYLLGIDDVIMVASFLEPTDYDNPHLFKPSVHNTIVLSFKVSEKYPDFEELISKVEKWWLDYVDTGISPPFDEKKDAEILKALRTNNLTPTSNIDDLIKEAELLKKELDDVNKSISDKEKRLKNIKNQLKDYAISKFREGDKQVELQGNKYTWTVSKAVTTTIDKDLLQNDGLLDKYSIQAESFRINVK